MPERKFIHGRGCVAIMVIYTNMKWLLTFYFTGESILYAMYRGEDNWIL